MLLAGISACSQTTSNTQNLPPIKIGFSISVTGDFNADGPGLQQGYQLWADTINKNGGLLWRPAPLGSLKDDRTPDKAAANYKTVVSVGYVVLAVWPISRRLAKSAL